MSLDLAETIERHHVDHVKQQGAGYEPAVAKTVNIGRLKAAVSKHFPNTSLFREMVTREPDEMPLSEYLTKVALWDRVMVRELSSAW